MTRAELLARISSAELIEWMSYEQLEPFGQETQYIGPAITSHTLAQINTPKGKKPPKLQEFIPKFERTQSAEQMLGMASYITQIYGGQDLREKDE